MKTNVDYNIMSDNIDNSVKMKFVIPIGSRKKWWQFWKEDEAIKAEKSIKEFMYKFKEDVNFDGDYILPVDNSKQ